MPNFQNKERLIQVLGILAEHRSRIETFYHAFLDLQLSNHNGNQLLRDAFAYSVSERRGASRTRGQEATGEFNRHVDNLFGLLGQRIQDNAASAHQHLFEELCQIPHIDQKIAAMFLKFVVVYFQKWPELAPYLFIPVDSVVLKILRVKLKVYSGPWKQSPSVKNPQRKLYVYNNSRACAQYEAFLEFQKELGNICSQANVYRILADELWFIGHVFCKEFPLCNRCWIKHWCQQSEET